MTDDVEDAATAGYIKGDRDGYDRGRQHGMVRGVTLAAERIRRACVDIETRQAENPTERTIQEIRLDTASRLLSVLNETAAEAPGIGLVPEHLRGDGPCSDCGTVDNVVWWVESVFWNQIVRQGEYLEPILCIPCFVTRTDAAGFRPQGWELSPNWHWETKAERAARMDAMPVEGGDDV